MAGIYLDLNDFILFPEVHPYGHQRIQYFPAKFQYMNNLSQI